MSYRYALAGNPNCGKTTLFNAVTGSNQYVGNWPGVTVEKKEGKVIGSEADASIVDLPGIYSLSPYSMEEIVTRNYLIDEKPDLIIDIVDATNLERNLYLTTQLAVYFFKYDIGNSDLFSLFGTVGGVGQILSMVSLPLLRRRWGGKQILAGALGVTIAGYLALFALSMAGVRAVAPLAATAFVIYIGFGLATVLTTVFLADTVDYGEYKTGSRNESVVFSMQTFVVKLASAVSVLIAGIGIDLIGLDDTAAVQSESTLLGLRLLMVGLPVLGLVFSILYFMKKYRLTEAETARISEALRQREGSKG